jgi:PP-loop superfamily ATP-utilizing enzyme
MLIDTLQRKLEKLRHDIAGMHSVLVAFSGGIDSSFVLKVAHEELGSCAIGVTAVSPTFPTSELETAKQSRAKSTPAMKSSDRQLELPPSFERCEPLLPL